MQLTPIRIIGENKRDGSKAGIAARKALKRRPGRPSNPKKTDQLIKAIQALSDAPGASKKRSLKNIKSKRKMSRLEKLPVELLEKVFLFCKSLDLPRSSPIIAAKLSSETIYTKTILDAFGPSWNEFYGHRLHVLQNLRQRSPVMNPNAQSAILRCRWATLPRMLTVKETWIQNNAKDHVFDPPYFLSKRIRPRFHVAEEEEVELPLVTAKEHFHSEFEDFTNFASERDGDPTQKDSQHCWYTLADLADDVEIPESLLLGPWTDEMIKYLFWLVKSGVRIEWLKSTSGESALAGLNTAILNGDTRAIHLLAWAGLDSRIDIDTLVWALHNAGGDKLTTITHLLRVGYDGHLFRDEKDIARLDMEFEEMRDEAQERNDLKRLEFLEELSESQAVLATLRHPF